MPRIGKNGTVAVVVAALLVLSSGIALASGEDSPSSEPDTAAALSAIPPEPVGIELESKRTATSQTFRLPDGTHETRVFETPLNYRDDDGDWVPIEEELEQSGAGLTNGNNSFDLTLPHRVGSDPVLISDGDEWVSQQLLGAKTKAVEAEGNSASYETVDPGTSFEFTSLANGLKEDIVIVDSSQPTSFRFELNASDGLVPTELKDGSIVFHDESGREVVTLPAPLMADSAPVPQISRAVDYSLEPQAKGKWLLTVEADREWLSQPERVWPARIDPSLLVKSASLDCTYGARRDQTGWGACAAYHGNQELLSAFWPKIAGEAEDEFARSALRFSLTPIPQSAYITNATMGLYSPSAALNTSGVQVLRATKPWAEMINWGTYNGSSAWTTKGGDYLLDDNATVLTSQRGSQAGWWNFSDGTHQGLIGIVRSWVSQGMPNHGLLVKLNDEGSRVCGPTSCTDRRVAFNSSASPNSSLRPYLSVSYYPPAPTGSGLTVPREGTQTARRLTLKADFGSGVTGVTFQFRPGPSSTFTTIPSSLVRDAQGQQVTWPMAVSGNHSAPVFFDAANASPGLAIAGGPIQVRALFDGTSGVGYSVPTSATVDPNIGGTRDATTAVGPGTVNLLTGNVTVNRTDVSIPGFGSALEFSRTHSSRDAGSASDTGVLGRGWKPGITVEAAGGAQWQKVTEVVASVEEKEEGFDDYVLLADLEGYEYAFEFSGGNYISPPGAQGWKLIRQDASHFALTDPGGNRTIFDNSSSGNAYLPTSVSQVGSGANSTRMVYQPIGGKRRLSMIIAPSAPGVTCTEGGPTAPPTALGCRTLVFSYQPATTWGAPSNLGDRLSAIAYHGPASASTMGSWEVAKYSYDTQGRLVSQWDPRISPNLKETYTYEGGQIRTITPPGEKPWTLEYEPPQGEFPNARRLLNVKRESLLSSPSIAQTTIVYGVPISGAGAAYEMSGAAVAQWGQQDIPTDATAIFPPDQIPAIPPTSYSRATVHYMDAEGQSVNTATSSGAGTTAPSITTAETDEHGNVTRELSAQNRLRALAAPEPVSRSHELETKRKFSPEGIVLAQEWGPLHEVRLESGSLVQARLHSVYDYDMGAPPTPPPGEPYYHLPTRVTVGANIPELPGQPGQPIDADQRVTETKYDWTLRKPTDTIVDPQGLNLRTHIEYDPVSGLPTERRLPANPNGGDARTTKTLYYTAGAHPSDSSCGGKPAWANLPCKVTPAAQSTPVGPPQLLVRKYAAYSPLAQPTEVLESPGGQAGGDFTRKSTLTYDSAGRELSSQQIGGGVAIPKTQSQYSPTTGRPTSQRFICEGGCGGSRSHAFSFGSSGSGNGQFNHPADVARDATGNLWIVDQNNRRVHKFNAQGEFISKFGSSGTGNGQFDRPTAIAIDPKGNLWIADAGNNRIQKFNDKGEYLSKFGSYGSGNGAFNSPEGIAIDSLGNVWVSDTSNNRVQKFSEAGAFIKVVGSKGSGAGQLSEPTALDIGPNGDVWIADWGNHRVSVFNDSGGFVRQFGSAGSGNGQFNRPSSIDVDHQGNVWVGEEADRIQRFDQSGAYVEQFGSSGSGAGQFNFSYAMGLTVDSENNIWIADTGNNRIQKWIADDQAVTATYDTLGRQTAYQDADGNTATQTYDLLGRPVITNDGKGTQTRVYDSVTGLLTELQDSAAGTFTASYNADGAITERGLPNGLVGKTTFDETGAPTHLAYVKMTMCSDNCTWLDFDAEESIHGQVLAQTSTLSSQLYYYDKAGRLIQARDTPQGSSCTTRSYSFDKNSNRTALITRAPGIGGACDTTSAGSTQSYSYDTGDRLLGTSLVYDNFGRITSLPAGYAGGKALSTSYFSTDMVAEQSQNGVTNTFQLDALGRQRQRLQAGGLEGTEVFHYAGGSDAPAWTSRGSSWSRNIVGIGGELAAIQGSSSGTTLQLTNLHGDVMATASLSQSATELLATFESDEFGNPKQSGPPRFGWLGGKQRRTELPSGVIQMGVRSYIPSLGRFLTPDPILGGSANAYDYADQDPVNAFDLEGTCSTKKRCAAALRKAETNVRKAIANVKSRVRQKRTESTRALPGFPGINIPRLPWEDNVNDAMKKATNALIVIDEAASCSDSGIVVGGVGHLLERYGGGLVGQAGTRIAAGVTKLGSKLTGAGIILGMAGVAGLC